MKRRKGSILRGKVIKCLCNLGVLPQCDSGIKEGFLQRYQSCGIIRLLMLYFPEVSEFPDDKDCICVSQC